MTTTHPTLGEARLPRNPLLSEVLALVSKQKTKAKKIRLISLMSDYPDFFTKTPSHRLSIALKHA